MSRGDCVGVRESGAEGDADTEVQGADVSIICYRPVKLCGVESFPAMYLNKGTIEKRENLPQRLRDVLAALNRN